MKFLLGFVVGVGYTAVQLVRRYNQDGNLSVVEESIRQGQERAKNNAQKRRDDADLAAFKEQLFGPGGQSRYF